jgi:hypothetical protein
MTPEQLNHTIDYCIRLFDNAVNTDNLPKPYPGIYTWANELGHEGVSVASEPVRIVFTIQDCIGYIAAYWKIHEDDVGIIVGRCARPITPLLWMVQFPNGDIMPYPSKYIIDHQLTVLNGKYKVPSHTRPTSSSAEPYEDPFEAVSKETYKK